MIIFFVILFLYFYTRQRSPRLLRIIRFDTINLIAEPLVHDGTQNVHDTNVRERLWAKYKVLHAEVKEKIKDYDENVLYAVAKKMPDYLRSICTDLEYTLLKQLVHQIYANEVPINDYEGNPHREHEIFAYCYYKFRKADLDKTVMKTQYLDCFENGATLCLVGRVSRYIGMFEGLIDGTLGETEETSQIIFQRALYEAKKMLTDALESNPEIKQIYNSDSIDDLENEKRLYDFLQILKGRVTNKLKNDYARLTTNEINDILTAIN